MSLRCAAIVYWAQGFDIVTSTNCILNPSWVEDYDNDGWHLAWTSLEQFHDSNAVFGRFFATKH